MARCNHAYTVAYRLYEHSDPIKVTVLAPDKWSAYDKAYDEIIMERHAFSPWNMWVEGVTYQNGNYRQIAKSESMY